MTTNKFIVDNILPYLQVFGSLLATGVALYLGLRDNLKRIEACFIWDGQTEYQPTILIQNMRKKIVVLDRVDIKIGREQIGGFDFSSEQKLQDCSFIEAERSEKIEIPENCVHSFKGKKYKGKRTVRIIIHLKDGRKYVSKQKYTYDELSGHVFGYYLFKK